MRRDRRRSPSLVVGHGGDSLHITEEGRVDRCLAFVVAEKIFKPTANSLAIVVDEDGRRDMVPREWVVE